MAESGSEKAINARNIAARHVWDALMQDEAATDFKVLPDPYLYPEYYAVIPRPIALSDIRDFATSPTPYTVEDIARDVERMLKNAKKFNVKDSPIFDAARTLEVRDFA